MRRWPREVLKQHVCYGSGHWDGLSLAPAPHRRFSTEEFRLRLRLEMYWKCFVLLGFLLTWSWVIFSRNRITEGVSVGWRLHPKLQHLNMTSRKIPWGKAKGQSSDYGVITINDTEKVFAHDAMLYLNVISSYWTASFLTKSFYSLDLMESSSCSTPLDLGHHYCHQRHQQGETPAVLLPVSCSTAPRLPLWLCSLPLTLTLLIAESKNVSTGGRKDPKVIFFTHPTPPH